MILARGAVLVPDPALVRPVGVRRGRGYEIKAPIKVRLVAAIVLGVAAFGSASEPFQQATFSYDALSARVPVLREHSYVVNAKVRPVLLFWIGRDNIGAARITWRKGAGRRTFEFLIGSDPARAPRQINRWGFIVEELDADNAEVLGVMRESNEETIEEAKAKTARQDGDVSAFRAARTSITGNRAVSGTMTVLAPAHLTYRELEALLALIPAEPPSMRTLELPPGTQKGFLVALDSLIRASVVPCRSADGAGTNGVITISYVYNRTLYDMSLLSCDYEPQLRAKTGTFADVVDGRFQVRNRTTKDETKFRVSYGISGELRGVPVRAVFRPRWWMEIELLLDLGKGT